MFKTPFNNSLLFWASPGLESEPFLIELLVKHLKEGLKAVLCVSDKSSQLLLDEAEGYGYEIKKYLGKSLFIIDFYEKLMNKAGLESLERLVKSKLKVLGKNSMLCFNNISVLINLFGVKAVDELVVLKDFIKELDGRCICSFTEWPYTSDLLIRIKESFDKRVYLNLVDGRKYYSYKKDGSFKHFLFKVKQPGGIVSLRPKLVVIGPRGAGKTSFIKALSDRSASVDYLSNDFGVDRAEFNYKGRVIDLFGAPGEDFNPLIELLGDELSGVLVMVDSSKPSTFNKARQIVNSVRSAGLNVVVGLNRLDTDVKEVKNQVGVDAPFIISEKGSNHDEIINQLLSY